MKPRFFLKYAEGSCENCGHLVKFDGKLDQEFFLCLHCRDCGAVFRIDHKYTCTLEPKTMTKVELPPARNSKSTDSKLPDEPRPPFPPAHYSLKFLDVHYQKVSRNFRKVEKSTFNHVVTTVGHRKDYLKNVNEMMNRMSNDSFIEMDTDVTKYSGPLMKDLGGGFHGR